MSFLFLSGTQPIFLHTKSQNPYGILGWNNG